MEFREGGSGFRHKGQIHKGRSIKAGFTACNPQQEAHEEGKDNKEWISNMRRVEKIVMEMESISVQAAAVKMKK